MADIKLTDEQVERAAEAMWDSLRDNRVVWSILTHADRTAWRNLARAAAPFLQAPWDEIPSLDEQLQFEAIEKKSNRYEALCNFVRIRNAALALKPVDPRREAIVRAIENQLAKGTSTARSIGDAVLKVLELS